MTILISVSITSSCTCLQHNEVLKKVCSFHELNINITSQELTRLINRKSNFNYTVEDILLSYSNSVGRSRNSLVQNLNVHHHHSDLPFDHIKTEFSRCLIFMTCSLKTLSLSHSHSRLCIHRVFYMKFLN